MAANESRALADRDPMLAAALAAHGATWRPGLREHLRLARDDARHLPGIEVRALGPLGHSIEWCAGDGCATLTQRWAARDKRWDPEGRRWDTIDAHWVTWFTMPGLPHTLADALVGRTLDAVIDAPGADAWLITGTDDIPGAVITMLLARR